MTSRERAEELVDALDAALKYPIPNREQLNETGYNLYVAVLQARVTLDLADALRNRAQ